MGLSGRVVKGFRDLTTAQLLKAKRAGVAGQTLGLVFATVFTIYRGFWYFSFFLAFTIFVMLVEFVSVSKQYKQARLVEEMQRVYRKE